jgi:O-antigen/teichoic acid export membrane protein
VVAVVARRLGPVGFGQYSLATILASVLATFADLGLGVVGLREATRRPSDARFLAGVIRYKILVQTVCFVALAPLLMVVTRPNILAVAVGVACLSMWLTMALAAVGLPVQREIRFGAIAAADVVGRVVQLAAVVLVGSVGGGLLAMVGAGLAVPLAGLAIVAPTARRRLCSWRGRLHSAERRALVRAGLPLAVLTVLGLFHFKLDSILLAWLRPANDLGMYSADYRIIEMILTVPQLLVAALFPVLARKHGSDLTRWVRVAFAWSWKLALPSLALVFIYAKPIVVLTAGSAFEPAAPALRVLVLATFFAWINVLIAQVAVVINAQSRVLAASVVGIVLNAGMNLLVIPRWGYFGAAWTTVVSEAVGFLMVLVITCRAWGSRIDLRPMGAAVLATGTFVVIVTRIPSVVGQAALVVVAGVSTVCMMRRSFSRSRSGQGLLRGS